MKVLLFLKILILSSIGYGQDTITIVKIGYSEKNIPEGWTNYLVSFHDSSMVFSELDYTSPALTNSVIIKPGAKLNRRLADKLAPGHYSKESMIVNKKNAFVFLEYYTVICHYEVIKEYGIKSILISQVKKIKESKIIDLQNLLHVVRLID